MPFALDTTDVLRDITACVFIQLSFYAILGSNKSIRDDPKRLSWVLTLLCSSFTSSFSLIYVYKYVWLGWDQDANFQSDPLAQFMAIFFTVFLFLDMICAKLHYFSQMGVLEGWVHHIVYIWFSSYIIYSGYCIGIVISFPFEAPTVVLAIGQLFPSMRSDWLFGGVFFVTRIVYHAYLLFKWYTMENEPANFWPMFAFVICFHVYWFVLWTRGQIRRMGKDMKGDKGY